MKHININIRPKSPRWPGWTIISADGLPPLETDAKGPELIQTIVERARLACGGNWILDTKLSTNTKFVLRPPKA